MIVARHEVPPEGPAPQELQDSGFNLGTLKTNGSPSQGVT
jgi:hypothetical protein